MKRIHKLGLIGCGSFGKNYVSTIAKMEDVEIVHVCTSNKDNKKLFNKNTKITSSYSEVCQDETLSGVIICTPPNTHLKIMKECLTYLMPFLVEKPICENLKDTKEIRSAINFAQVPCLIDYTQLFNSAFAELITRSRFQKIKTITSKASSYGPFRSDVSMLLDWLPHDLSMCMTLLGEKPIKVRAEFKKSDEQPNSGELGVDISFKNTEVHIFINNLGNSKYRAFSAFGNFNTLTMFGGELYEIVSTEIRKIAVSNEQPLTRVINSFIETIETQVSVGVDMSVDIANAIEKCQESIDKKSEYIYCASK